LRTATSSAQSMPRTRNCSGFDELGTGLFLFAAT
jgi:hypothetical protein